MALTSEQFEENEKTSEEPKASSESCDVIRSKIDRFLRDENFRKTLNKESLQGYQDVADKKGHIDPNDLENLQKFYNYMKDGWEDDVQPVLDRMDDHIDHAIKDKIIAKTDRDFYDEKMDENVLTGNQNVDKGIIEKAEKELLDSLEKRRKERKEYNDLMKSGLVEDGLLALGKDETKEMPDEQGYLKMTVKERRKFLKEIKGLLPKAKKYSEEKEKIEAKELEKEYGKLIKAAKKEGIIGNKVINKFMEWFKGQDNEAKEDAIKQFFKEMSRYRELWKDIKSTLKGSPLLSHMEGLRDSKGHSELCEAFEKAIEKEYEGKQKKDFNRKPKLISRHTMRDNAEAIKAAPLETKKHYLEAYDQEMERYKTLRADIDGLKDKKIQKALNEMYKNGANGHKEIRAKYNRLTGQGLDKSDDEATKKEMGDVTNITAIQAAKAADKNLSRNQKEKLFDRLTHFFANKNAGKQDAFSYEDRVRKVRLEQQESYSEQPLGDMQDLKKQAANEDKEVITRPFGTSDPNKELPKEPKLKHKKSVQDKIKKTPQIKIKTNEDRTFEQRTYSGEKGDKRVSQVYAGYDKGVQHFNSESLLNENTDELSVMAWDGNKGIELKMHEINAFIRYMRKSLNNELEEEQIKKAA